MKTSGGPLAVRAGAELFRRVDPGEEGVSLGGLRPGDHPAPRSGMREALFIETFLDARVAPKGGGQRWA